MRNRSTDLIEWNDALSEGMGCSGTRYALSYGRSGDDGPLDRDARRHWLLTVDGFTMCSVESAQDALARSEALEALRCILRGRCDQISDEHWRVAALIASEMLEAATDALSHFPAAELTDCTNVRVLDPIRRDVVVVMNLLSVGLIGQIDSLVGAVRWSLFKHALIQVNNVAFEVRIVF
jgi:hypothetical protein